MPTLTLALKDLRLLLRDPRSAVILLLMPVVLVFVLGLALGEGFGQKPDDKLRISIVNKDRGLPDKPGRTFPPKPWSQMVIDDLTSNSDVGEGGIRVELIESEEVAKDLLARSKRAAVIVFEPEFSDRMDRCSFLAKPGYEPVNPLGRDGVKLERLALTVLRDHTQKTAAAIIEQATQVTLFRVTIPYMIGQAFARVGDEQFMKEVVNKIENRPVPPEAMPELEPAMKKLLDTLFTNDAFRARLRKKFGAAVSLGILAQKDDFRDLIGEALRDKDIAAALSEKVNFGNVITESIRKEIGPPVKDGVKELFPDYDFNALTWPDLTRTAARAGNESNRAAYAESDGSGVLKRGAVRYQVLVPSYTVMFAFFLVLTVGWLFVTERKHGTLLRLRAAPLSRGQILLGKLLPCLVVSLVQGFFVLLAGKLVFGMSWGPQPWLLVPVVVCTSVAAVGLAMLVASVARTETQVAVYGTLLVLVLGGVSGSLMPRDLMPEQMKQISLVTPHAWALDAYAQLLASPTPEVSVVWTACLALLGFGAAFLALAWWRLDLE
jgi:hypothetical protein